MRRPSPTIIAAIFFILFDSFVLYGAYVKRNLELQPIPLSAAAPNVVWKDFDGKEHALKALTGHVVVLHFWASWCPPCREEFPKLLQAAAADKDIIFLTISTDDGIDRPEKFIKRAEAQSGVTPPPNVLFAWDPDKTITYDQFLTDRYPESIIIDPTQHLRRKFPTPVNWDDPTVRAYLVGLKKEAKAKN